MAKNIDFMGAVFPDVPSVKLPQQGGGLVAFDDTTDATATADKILQGYTAYANGQKLVGTASGGITPSGTYSITSNGTYDVTQYASADVNVSGGGKNAQINNSMVSIATDAGVLTETGLSINVAKTGVYDVFWAHYRPSASGATPMTQLSIDGVGFGDKISTFGPSLKIIQNGHVSNVSLTAGQVLSLKASSKGSGIMDYLFNLTIIEV